MRRYLFFALFFSLPSVFACDITVRVEEYSAQSQKVGERWYGLDVELARLLLDEAQCQYSFVDLPWGRSLKLLETGEIDMMMTVSKTPSRKKLFDFIGPQRMETIVFVSHPQTPDIDHINTLFKLDKPFAIQTGSYYGEALNNALQKSANQGRHVIYVANNQTKVDLFNTKRISGYIEAKLNVRFEIEQAKVPANSKIHPLIINQAPVYYAFSKQSLTKNTLNRIEKAYNKLTKAGEFQQIIAKYHLD